MIWRSDTEKLHEFINFLNKQHPNFQFTADDKYNYELPFLKFSVIVLLYGYISTDLYIKPSDTYQYLQSSSSAPLTHQPVNPLKSIH